MRRALGAGVVAVVLTFGSLVGLAGPAGAAPVSYTDRGAREVLRRPATVTEVRLDLAASSVQVDASQSAPGEVPIGSYRFDFGDGTVLTQSSAIASHRYAQPGEYNVVTTAVGTDGQSSDRRDFVTVLPFVSTVALLSLENLRYVEYVPDKFRASQLGVTPEGQFDIVGGGSGQVALVSRGSGKYLTVSSQWIAIDSRFTYAGVSERFTLVRNADGSISLRSAENDHYVGVLEAQSPTLYPAYPSITRLAKFHEVRAGDQARTLKAYANGKFVSAESAGVKPLIASRPAANNWERFDIVELGNGQVALFARANNQFVAAEQAGAQPLQAKRVAVSGWERFTLVRNTDGSVSLKAAVNNKYVAAEAAGAQPLLAGRTAIGTWERFTLG